MVITGISPMCGRGARRLTPDEHRGVELAVRRARGAELMRQLVIADALAASRGGASPRLAG